MNFTKIDQADLDSPHRELSNGGLGIVVALMFFLGLFFSPRLADRQSSCMCDSNWSTMQDPINLLDQPQLAVAKKVRMPSIGACKLVWILYCLEGIFHLNLLLRCIANNGITSSCYNMLSQDLSYWQHVWHHLRVQEKRRWLCWVCIPFS